MRYINQDVGSLLSTPANAPAFDSLTATAGALTTVRGYDGEAGTAVLAGTVFGTEASGERKPTDYTNPDIYVLSDGSGNNRYPITAGQDGVEIGSPLSTTEVGALLNQAFSVMNHARAAIRQPLNTRAQVTLSVTDTYGKILGLIVAPDATLFGVDVSVQKARSVAFMSGRYAASDLSGATRDPALAMGDADTEVQAFVAEVRTFPGLPNALTDDHAYADRSLGDIARPFFPDGQDGTANGARRLGCRLALHAAGQRPLAAGGGPRPDAFTADRPLQPERPEGRHTDLRDSRLVLHRRAGVRHGAGAPLLPVPTGVATSERAGQDDPFGRSDSLLFSQT